MMEKVFTLQLICEQHCYLYVKEFVFLSMTDF